MKKVLVSSAIVLAVLLASCLSIPQAAPAGPPPVYDVSIESEKGLGAATVFARHQWEEYGIVGFAITVKNESDKILRVVWEKSSIAYNEKSYPIFVDGQKFKDATASMPPMAVPAKGTISKGVYSSDQPYFVSAGRSSEWGMHKIISRNIQIMLCVQSGDVEDYYTITFKQLSK